jgi:uncharacterized protein YcfJ
MKATTKAILGSLALAFGTHAAAQVTFFGREGFAGRSFTANGPVSEFSRHGFNDRASSAVVRGGTWEVCEHTWYDGRCVVLRPGTYGSLAAMGLDNDLSSARPVGNSAHRGEYRPFQSSSGHDYRRRRNERIFEAEVTSVRAVVGPPQQRCWIEQQAATAPAASNSIPGAIAGAIIGGILGHQVGGGRGQDIATGVGAVGGAALGATLGRGSGGDTVVMQDVQRCEHVSTYSQPDYWDVTYHFRGREHRVQMTAPPGPTILVNRSGEPRV